MNTKYTVELDEESLLFEVIEWSEKDQFGMRTGKVIGKHREEWSAIVDCEILNKGYEYEMSAIASSEFDE